MSNGINSRQNEERSIQMLAAQRELYSEAKRIEYIEWSFSIAIPLMLTIIQIRFRNNLSIDFILVIFSFLSMVFSLLTHSKTKKKKEDAATIQQKFDTYVFMMSWDKKLFGENINNNNLIAEKSIKHYKKSDTKQRLYNWYRPTVDKAKLDKGIWLCQRENYFWDVDTRKKYQLSIVCITLLLIIIAIVAGMILNSLLISFLCNVACLGPIFVFLGQKIIKLNDDIKRLDEIHELTNEKNFKITHLKKIQKLIYDNRKNLTPIPDFINNIFKNDNELVAEETINLELEEYEKEKPEE